MGPSNQKEKPRDRPLSAPNQAAIQGLISLDPQIKALQPQPQSPGQVQKPQPGSNPVSIAAVKLVSPRCRSHSPRCRIDVEVELEDQGGWQKGMMPAVSHESLMGPSDWEVAASDPTDPLSQSFPDGALRSALSRQRDSYSPAFNSGNLLQNPDKHHCLFPASDRERREGRCGENTIRGSSSMSDLSAFDIFRQNLAEGRQMSGCSAGHLPSSSPTAQAPWLCRSPRTSPQTSPSHSPMSSSPSSIGTLSPQFSAVYFASNMAPKCLKKPTAHHASYPVFISPASTPRGSPYGSPFGSQIQICIGSVGTEG